MTQPAVSPPGAGEGGAGTSPAAGTGTGAPAPAEGAITVTGTDTGTGTGTGTGTPAPTAPAADNLRTSGRDDANSGVGPAAGATPPAPVPASDAGAGTGTGGTGTQPPAGGTGTDWKVEDLPAGAQKLITDLRKEAGDNRRATTAATKAAKAAEDKMAGLLDGFAKVLGLAPEDPATPPDPEKLTAQLADATTAHRELQVRLAAWEAGADASVDMRELMDSASFLNAIRGLDPAEDGFADKLAEAVRTTVDRNPGRFKKVTGLAPAPPPSGGQFTGGPGGQQPDLSAMSVEDHFRELRKDREGSPA